MGRARKRLRRAGRRIQPRRTLQVRGHLLRRGRSGSHEWRSRQRRLLVDHLQARGRRDLLIGDFKRQGRATWVAPPPKNRLSAAWPTISGSPSGSTTGMRQRPVSPPAPSAFESPNAPDAASRSAQGSGAPPVARPDKNEAVSTGADKISDSGTYESLACRFVIENPGHRIVSNEVHSLDLSVAAARFVWMISGNNRLADIEFHDPIVKNFTDDEIIVPGSSYGTRIRQAHPGIDQLSGTIAALHKDPNSRRAAISICQPTDSTRYASKDMPCAFGMFFHAREGALHAQLVMRSNNAATLLPFNLFEFSLLAEMVASECG